MEGKINPITNLLDDSHGKIILSDHHMTEAEYYKREKDENVAGFIGSNRGEVFLICAYLPVNNFLVICSYLLGFIR